METKTDILSKILSNKNLRGETLAMFSIGSFVKVKSNGDHTASWEGRLLELREGIALVQHGGRNTPESLRSMGMKVCVPIGCIEPLDDGGENNNFN